MTTLPPAVRSAVARLPEGDPVRPLVELLENEQDPRILAAVVRRLVEEAKKEGPAAGRDGAGPEVAGGRGQPHSM